MPCVTSVAGYPVDFIRQAEPGISDLQEYVAREEHVAEVEPELGECARDEYRTVALPDVGVGVARLAVRVTADPAVERAEHTVRVYAEQAIPGEPGLDRGDGGFSADEIDGIAELRGICTAITPAIESLLVVPYCEPYRVGHDLKRVPQRRGGLAVEAMSCDERSCLEFVVCVEVCVEHEGRFGGLRRDGAQPGVGPGIACPRSSSRGNPWCAAAHRSEDPSDAPIARVQAGH